MFFRERTRGVDDILAGWEIRETESTRCPFRFQFVDRPQEGCRGLFESFSRNAVAPDGVLKDVREIQLDQFASGPFFRVAGSLAPRLPQIPRPESSSSAPR